MQGMDHQTLQVHFPLALVWLREKEITETLNQHAASHKLTFYVLLPFLLFQMGVFNFWNDTIISNEPG